MGYSFAAQLFEALLLALVYNRKAINDSYRTDIDGELLFLDKSACMQLLYFEVVTFFQIIHSFIRKA